MLCSELVAEADAGCSTPLEVGHVIGAWQLSGGYVGMQQAVLSVYVILSKHLRFCLSRLKCILWGQAAISDFYRLEPSGVVQTTGMSVSELMSF